MTWKNGFGIHWTGRQSVAGMLLLALVYFCGVNTVLGSYSKSEIVLLEPDKPIVIKVSPYELCEVYIPVEQLDASQDYWIKSSF